MKGTRDDRGANRMVIYGNKLKVRDFREKILERGALAIRRAAENDHPPYT